MAPEAHDLRWYCVHTKPRSEVVALENLQRQGFHCFLPRIRRSRITAGRRCSVDEALFPRYLFLQADATAQSLASVRSTRGAVDLVRFAITPSVVPNDLITRLQQDSSENGVIVLPDTPLHHGDPVHAETGVFRGLCGVYLETCGNHRATVLLELLGSMRRVQIDMEQLHRSSVAFAC
ncbi:MAG: transcriptional activator RfaH [Caldilineaceae bacterium]|nr:transcriptional activator RfaH [Caldilineaceae bacterium]